MCCRYNKCFWVVCTYYSALVILVIRGDGQHIDPPIVEAHQPPDDGGPDQTFAVDIPAFVYETTDDGRAGGGGGGETPCSVCLEVVKGGEMVRKLPVCDHVFHVECIDMWLRTHSTCPNCRSRVGPPEEVRMVGVDDSPAQPSAPPVEPGEII